MDDWGLSRRKIPIILLHKSAYCHWHVQSILAHANLAGSKPRHHTCTLSFSHNSASNGICDVGEMEDLIPRTTSTRLLSLSCEILDDLLKGWTGRAEYLDT